MKTADRVLSVLLIVLSGFWIVWARQLPYPKFAQVSGMGPGDFPIMVATALAVCAIWLFAETFRRRVESKPEKDSDETEIVKNPAAKRDIITGFALFTGMLVIIPFAGFSLAAAIFVLGFLLVIGRYRLRAAGPIAILIPAMLWFIFDYLLTVPLPQGPWGF